MNLLVDIVIISLLFAVFGVLHSVLASQYVKRKIAETAGEKIAFYRFFYNVSSILIFVVIYKSAPRPDIRIYDLRFPFDIAIVILQILSLFGLLSAAKFINIKEFLGLNQIIRYFKNKYEISELDERVELIIRGPFKYSRHPIYFFSILFLGFRPAMDLFYLTAYICMIAYFLIGAYFEEKKMAEKFGDEYLKYKNEVPKLIPYKILIKKGEF